MPAPTLADILTIVGLTLLALGGGTFWSFSTGVMPGLRRTDDTAFVTAMRAINRAVINPLFLLPIFLPPVLLGWAGFLQRTEPRGWLLIASGLVFLVGVVVVTMVGNVPLNNALDTSTEADGPARTAFERRWNAWNGVRSAASVVAIALAASALVL